MWHFPASKKSTRLIQTKYYRHFQNMNLADSGPSGNINLLIGSVNYWDFITKVMVGETSELSAPEIALE